MSTSGKVAGVPADSPVRHSVDRIVASTRARQGGALEHARAFLERALAVEPVIHAFNGIDPARVVAQAQAIDASAVAGTESNDRTGPLSGVPVGVKDIIDAQGWTTGMGSPIHEHSMPARDARLVARLKAAGAYVFGKTVTTEFAFMHPRETRNPWNPAHTPGGSSSGSAAAVAAGCVPVALATQTNGSVIRPAAFCGVVGFKPSLGAFSAEGVLSYAPTLDQPGCLSRSVADVARVSSVLAEAGFRIPAAPAASVRPRLIAVRTPAWPLADPAMQAEFERVCARFVAAGARVESQDLPAAFGEAHEVHRLIMGFEASRYFVSVQAAHRGLLSDWLNRYLDQAAAIPGTAYREALGVRESLQHDFAGFIAGQDAVLTPPARGEAPAGIETSGDPVFCSIWTLLGTPAITVPTGLGPTGLPLGLQIVGARGDDDRVLAVAAWCERLLGFAGLIEC